MVSTAPEVSERSPSRSKRSSWGSVVGDWFVQMTFSFLFWFCALIDMGIERFEGLAEREELRAVKEEFDRRRRVARVETAKRDLRAIERSLR